MVIAVLSKPETSDEVPCARLFTRLALARAERLRASMDFG